MKLLTNPLAFSRAIPICTPRSATAAFARGRHRALRRAGYDFVTLTDHRVISPERREQGLLVLSGTELDYGFSNQVVHITALGLAAAFDAQAVCDEDAGARPEDGVAAIRAAAGRAILAHPCWSLNTLEMLARLDGIAALEIYNTVSGSPWNADRAESASFSDVASTNGRVVPVVGADDAHFYDGDECQTCILVNARELTREALLEAVDAGAFTPRAARASSRRSL